MKKRTIIIIAIVLVVGIVIGVAFYKKDAIETALLTVATKRQKLKEWVNGTTDSANNKALFAAAVDRMTESEVNTVYDIVYNYFLKNKTVPQDTKIFTELNAISNTYGIFG